jgi:hypothetical protein
MNTETIGEVGNLSAPPGSRDWAVAVRLKIQAGLSSTLSDAASLSGWLRMMERHNGYKQLPDANGQTFPSYRAFCEAKQPWGLGYAPDAIERLLAERMTPSDRAHRPLTLLDNPGPATAEERESIVDIINNRESGGGTSADYLTARIARDRPDILEDMKAGKYPSVRAAALQAGIVKARVSVPLDPVGAAAVLARHFDIEALIDALCKLQTPGE